MDKIKTGICFSISTVSMAALVAIVLFFTSSAFGQARVFFDSWHTFSDQHKSGSNAQVFRASNPLLGTYFNLHKSISPAQGQGPYPYVGVSFPAPDSSGKLKRQSKLLVVYKSTGPLDIVLQQTGINSGDAYFTSLPVSPKYREVTVPISDFEVPPWSESEADITKHPVSAIKFQVSGNQAASVELWIKSVSLILNPSVNQTDWKIINSSGQTNQIKRHENGLVRFKENLYLLGGRSKEGNEIQSTMVLNTVDRKWKRLSKPPIEMHHIQPVVYNNKIYILAGYSGYCCKETALKHIYIYEPETDKWTVGPEIPESFRRGSAGVALVAGKFYLGGGVVGGHHDIQTRALRSMSEYDPVSNQWKMLEDMPRVRDHFQAITIGPYIYFIGGRDSSAPDNSLTIKEIDVYDTSEKTWKTFPQSSDIPTPRSGASYVLRKDRIYVIGGESLDTVHTVVEIFNTKSGVWSSESALNIPRHGTQAALSGDEIYIAAGAIDVLVNESGSMEILQLE